MSLNSFNFVVNSTPEHQLLRELYHCSPSATDEQITSLVKKHFKSVIFESTTDSIVSSVAVLLKDAAKFSSEKEAKLEINGAIYALNILLKHETRGSKQKELMVKLNTLSSQSMRIDDIFLLKDAMQNDDKMKTDNRLQENILKDGEFLEVFSHLRSFYGRKFTLENSCITGLILLWNNPKNFPVRVEGTLMEGEADECLMPAKEILKKFLHHAPQARKTCFKILSEGGFDYSESIEHFQARCSYEDLCGAIFELPHKESKSLLTAIEEISYHRAMLYSNAEMHSDRLGAVFAGRETLSDDSNQQKYEKKLKQLNALLAQADLDANLRKQVEIEVSLLKQLEGFHPAQKGAGIIFHQARWVCKENIHNPPSTVNSLSLRLPTAANPIQPMDRVLTFATKNGIKREARMRLDFTKALGDQNLDLNGRERSMLGELLVVCDEIAQGITFPDDNVAYSKTLTPILEELNLCGSPLIKKLDVEQKLKIAKTLDLFNDPAHPHLRNVSHDNKVGLAVQALIFSFEIHYKVADILLNIT